MVLNDEIKSSWELNRVELVPSFLGESPEEATVHRYLVLTWQQVGMGNRRIENPMRGAA